MRNPFDFSELTCEGFEWIQKMDPEKVARDMAPITIIMPRKMAKFLKDDLKGLLGCMEVFVDMASGIKDEEFCQAFAPIKESLPTKSLMVSLYVSAIDVALATQEREAPKEDAKN